ncbi:MAG: hypothetical protein E7774_06255 [Bradyrhizobium sp.]|nr:MAG: hypothetical protein E7774_06255 [Bradyrhizobium sp.]
MPILLKSVAGLFAGVVSGTVGLAVWMPDEARPVQPHIAAVALQRVETSGPSELDKAALKRLAQAMGAGDPDPVGAPRGLETQSVGLASPGDDALRLRAQGLVALAGGEVAEARAFLERAGEAGDARAYLVLGDTYDPTTLARLGAIGIKGDVSRAGDYYARAREAGLAAASPRVASAEIAQ